MVPRRCSWQAWCVVPAKGELHACSPGTGPIADFPDPAQIRGAALATSGTEEPTAPPPDPAGSALVTLTAMASSSLTSCTALGASGSKVLVERTPQSGSMLEGIGGGIIGVVVRPLFTPAVTRVRHR
jgi:hypothetical protein